MDGQVQNEQAMQYRMPLPERRDSNLESNGSTPFQPHQSLGQALGPQTLPGTVRPAVAYPRPDNFRNISTSPTGLNQNGGPSQSHPGVSSSHSPLFVVTPGQSSPGMKRKQIDTVMGTQVLKRRRDDDGDSFDIDGGAQGAKHWTDEEKSKLFSWLMGPGQDDHWNSLRATKNSCLRECAVEVFGSKKTYQALKGCYERNFNLFKQIYAFENYTAHSSNISVGSMSEADRLREYERRLQTARKANCDVGNVTARTIDHWHRVGWYDLFYRRWHGDPATTRPVQPRNSTAGPSNSGGGDDPDGDDDQTIDFSDPVTLVNGMNGMSHDRSHPMSFINPHNMRDPVPPPSTTPITATPSGSGQIPPAMTPSSSDQAFNLSVTQGMVSSLMQYLQVQTQTSKMKLEYMRRRDEREERESNQRREGERVKKEREAAEFEYTKQKAAAQQKTDRAIEIIGNPIVDATVKQAASEFLKKLFTTD